MPDSLRPHGLQHARLPCPSHLSEFAQSHVHWVGDAIQPSHLLLPPSPLAFSLSQLQGLFLWVCSLHQVAKLWSFSCSIRPYIEYSGLISFRIDWFALFAVQGTLKGLLQHHGSKASFLWCSAFFMVQLSHPYVTTGNTIVLTIRTFVSKGISLLLICFLGLSLLFFQGVSFNFMAAVTICSDFGAQGNKVCHCFHHFPIYFPRSMWPDVRVGL